MTDLPQPLRRQVARASARLTLPIWAGLVAACSVVAGFGWLSLHELGEARQRGCRDRNSAQELGRRDLRRLGDGMRVELGPSADEPIARILGGLSTPAEADTDCDGDGWLTDADYTVPKPEALPIQLPVG